MATLNDLIPPSILTPAFQHKNSELGFFSYLKYKSLLAFSGLYVNNCKNLW